MRCGNLCTAGSRDCELPSRGARSTRFQSSPCRGAPSRFPSGILTRWVQSVERGRAANLDDPSSRLYSAWFFSREPLSSFRAQGPLSCLPIGLQVLQESSPAACSLLTALGCLPNSWTQGCEHKPHRSQSRLDATLVYLLLKLAILFFSFFLTSLGILEVALNAFE